jgi:urea transport system ATP-binding protein
MATLLGRSTPEEFERIGKALETIGLTEKANVRAGSLSHGEKQWLEIGMVILQDPQLLLVDEPVAGMTDKETEQTGVLLQSLADKHAIIVIEHDMEFVRQIARIVTVLHEGAVICEGPVDKVQSDPKVQEIYLGHRKPQDKRAQAR